jgi:toxin ParE1/3/4
MSYRVVLTDMAESDVEIVLKWFRDQQAVDAGRRWFGELLSRLDTLTAQPERCVLAAESEDFDMEIREILLGRGRYKHRILFNVSGKMVSILRVWHSSRDSISRDDLAR